MYRTLTEAEWVFEYAKKKADKGEIPLPVVLGTRGTWTGNGKPMIILISLTGIVDVLTLADIYGVAHHPVREVKIHEVTYYAINIIDKKQVKEIINEWKNDER
ncbi:hypothetical protein [Niallia taxi]|uniref:hypothetical protein n=1 Tax=Niallia taxi TaxID=2499688 RepID=UPI0015F5BFA5|nr:hypothetical protein [Niallia taxi]